VRDNLDSEQQHNRIANRTPQGQSQALWGVSICTW